MVSKHIPERVDDKALLRCAWNVNAIPPLLRCENCLWEDDLVPKACIRSQTDESLNFPDRPPGCLLSRADAHPGFTRSAVRHHFHTLLFTECCLPGFSTPPLCALPVGGREDVLFHQGGGGGGGCVICGTEWPFTRTSPVLRSSSSAFCLGSLLCQSACPPVLSGATLIDPPPVCGILSFPFSCCSEPVLQPVVI